jgi:hypothetical protein
MLSQEMCVEWLKMLLKDTANLRIGLYQNNVTPGSTTVLADLTAATFSGYAEVTPSAPTPAWSTPNSRAEAAFANAVFTHSSGSTNNTIYGAYIYNATDGKLVAAGAFAAPLTMTNNGDQITVAATLTQATA